MLITVHQGAFSSDIPPAVLLLAVELRQKDGGSDAKVSGLIPKYLQVVGLTTGNNDFRFAITIQIGRLDVFHSYLGPA